MLGRISQGAISVLLAVTTLNGCGGGGASAPGNARGGSSPTFTINLSSGSVTLSSSGSQTLTVSGQTSDGSKVTVGCNVTGVPVGVNITPAVFNLTIGTPQQLQLTLNNAAVSGTSTVAVACANGAQQGSSQFSLIVQATPGIALTALPTSFTMYPLNPAPVTQNVLIGIVGIGGAIGNVTGSVTGLPAGITVDQPTFTGEINTNDVMLAFTAASTATTSGSATVTVANGTLSSTLSIPITVSTSPDFTLSVNNSSPLYIAQSSTVNLSVSVNPINGFNQPVNLSFAGMPDGVTIAPSSLTIQPGKPQQVVISSTFGPPINSSATITVTATGGGVTHQSQFTLTIEPATVSMSAQPTSLSVPNGSTGSFFLYVNGQPNGLGSINVQLGAPPSGIQLSPTNFTVPGTGARMQIYVEAASSAVSGTLSATATYGPLTAQFSLPLTISPAESLTPVPLTTADQLVRTDALMDYASFPPPNYLIYHAATNRFFSTDALLNQLNVVDGSSHALAATLTIPGAFGLDQAPDGSAVYVGTMLGDLYVVDPVGLAILKRYPAASIGSTGFSANAVYAMADGSLLLEQYLLLPVFSWVDGNGPLARWNPSTNALTIFSPPAGGGPPTTICFPKFQTAVLTNNRTRVLLAPVQSSQGSSQLCSFDPASGTWNLSQTISAGPNSAFGSFAVSADGNTLVAYDGFNVYSLNPATLAVLSSFPDPTPVPVLFNYPAMFLSQDGKQVFISEPEPSGADILDVYDLATGKQTGWMPQTNLPTPGSIDLEVPLYQAMSSNGVAAGVIQDGGIGLLDTTAVHPMPVGSHFSQTPLDVPYGPVGGGTPDSWQPDNFGVPVPPLGSIYFGSNLATGLDNAAFDNYLEAVTPASSPGPVDVRTFATDGGSQLIPFGFSYGPWVLEAPTNYATAEGGGPASIYGFGFGPPIVITNGSSTTAPPSDLEVTIGGAQATVNGFNPNPYNSTFSTAPPFPTNALVYTLPAGAPGTTSSITVSNGSGSTTAPTQITYLPAVKQYSVDGQLADGVYDAKRNLYYFSDANQVRVFSVQNGWQPSILVPAPQNAYGAQRLFSLAISPDGSKLAISDPGAIAIYIVNLDQPSQVQTFPYASQIIPEPITEESSGVAITNSGNVYFVAFDLDGDGSEYMYVLDPSTGKINEVTRSQVPRTLSNDGPDPDGRLAITADGSKIYFNDNGTLGYVDIATGEFVLPPYNPNTSNVGEGGYELVLSPDQTTLFAEGFFLDNNFNPFGFQTLDTAQLVDAQYVYGAAMSVDGSLLFQPGTQSIDVFDGHTGSFRARVSLPMQLSPNFRALVSDSQDSRLVAITGATGNGVAVIDLTTIPEPDPLPYLSDTSESPMAQPHLSTAGSVPVDRKLKRSSLAREALIHVRSSPLLDSMRKARGGSKSTAYPAHL